MTSTENCKKKPILLIVVNVAWFFVMHRLSLAKAARLWGYDVHVACGVGEGADDVIREGFEYHELPLRRDAFNPVSDLKTILALAVLYSKLKPSIVHHVTLKSIVFGSIAARLVGVPAVVNAFAGLGYAFTEGKNALRYFMEMLLRLTTAHKNSRVLCENNDDRLLLEASGCVPVGSIVVTPGVGVSTDVFKPSALPEGKIRVMFAGRMLREKGVEDFVTAARILLSSGVAARFVLTGKPDPENPGSVSANEISAWVGEGTVEWESFRTDMVQAHSESHIICLPTYYREGVPRILLEAASCGRALVASDMPGCRDIVRNEINGLLVPPKNPRLLAEALKKLIDNRDAIKEMGERGRRIVEAEFSVETVLGQVKTVYEELLESS